MLRSDSECWRLVECLLERDPYGMSAELNAMDWVLESKCDGVSEVILYASDTPEGEHSAKLLRGFLEKACSGITVSVKRVGGLGRDFWPGLLELVRTLVRDVRRLVAEKEYSVIYLNATGGFKPETAMALVAASLAGPVAAYYKHESMRETVMLPPVPLALDRSRLRSIIAKLDHLAEEAGRPGFKVRLDDERYIEVQWLLRFMASRGVLQGVGGGYYTGGARAAEMF
ncbi:MAG: putative CRISPR-associated protein, partial [Mariprofundales bacterium]|nr:putative CRISPR-associated protein [Mariprofundales bacterium]